LRTRWLLPGSAYVSLLAYMTRIRLFKQDNDVPYGFMDFSTNTPQIQTASPSLTPFSPYPDQIIQSNIAEAGTLSLEWFTLSKYTGNATYGNLTARSVKHIANLVRHLCLFLRSRY
jgi:hypothetical protein